MIEHLAGIPMRPAFRAQPCDGVFEMELLLHPRVVIGLDRLRPPRRFAIEVLLVIDAVPLALEGCQQARMVPEVMEDVAMRIRTI
jgi:hypothetical protein